MCGVRESTVLSKDIELSVKAIERTFNGNPDLIRHPRKPILRCIDHVAYVHVAKDVEAFTIDPLLPCQP